MKTMKIIFALLSVLFVTQASPGYTLTNDCAAEVNVTVTNTVKLGAKLDVYYSLRATTNMPQSFMDHLTLDSIGVFVFDSKWKLLPTKVDYPKKPLQFPKVDVGGSNRIREISIAPYEAGFDLSKYCDITEPGIYRVLIVCPVRKWKGPFECEIASKPAEFMVVP